MSERKKISTRIWRPLIDSLERKVEGACLRRDSYLSRVLTVEVPYLDEEVTEANSLDAYTYVTAQLNQLDRKLVTLSLENDVVDQLDDVCSRKRINRDAFFNRLFLMLCASPKLIDILFFEDDAGWRSEVWSQRMYDGPFFQNIFYPLKPDIDPLWTIRTGLQLYADNPEVIDPPTGLIYTSYFPELKDANLVGMSTFLPDYLVPGNTSETALSKELDEILGIGGTT